MLSKPPELKNDSICASLANVIVCVVATVCVPVWPAHAVDLELAPPAVTLEPSAAALSLFALIVARSVATVDNASMLSDVVSDE